MSLTFLGVFNSLLAQDLPDSVQKKLDSVADSSKVEILRRLGLQYHESGNYAAALLAKFEALKWAEEINSHQLLFLTLHDLASYYEYNKSFASAESFAQRAEQIALEQKNNENLYEIYDLLGGFIYFNQGKYNDSYRYGLKLLELAELSGDRARIAYVNSYLGDVYRVQGKYTDALAIYKKALAAAQAAGDKNWERSFLNRIALVYDGQQMTVEALAYYKASLVHAYQANNEYTIMNYSVQVAAKYLDLDSLEQSESLAEQSLKLAKKFNDSRMLVESLLILKKSAQRRKDFRRAYMLGEEAFHLQDSVNSGKFQTDLVNFRTKYEMDKRDEQIGLLEETSRLQLTIRNILMAGSVLLLLAIFLVGRQYKIAQTARKNAEQKNDELAIAFKELKATQSLLIQSEKMASLGKLTAGIAHEIQNPLNFVNNFSQLNNELLSELADEIERGNFDEVKSLAQSVAENQKKINNHGKRADEIVKGMLQHSRTSSGQKELKDLNALADEYLRLAFHGLRAKDNSFNPKFETDFDPLLPKINLVAQDIGRVVLNLINNAFYAVAEKKKIQPSNYSPLVRVMTKKISEKEVELRVIDNANGIPQKIMDKIFQPFFTTKPTGQGTGLGLSLSYDIVKAHGGEINLQTKENEGTEFIVRLPV